MLFVKIDEPSPYTDEFAFAIASSRSFTMKSGTAGPKTSSVAMRESSGTSFSTVAG